MTAPQTPLPASKTARLIHGAMCMGVFLFALMVRFFVLPTSGPVGTLTPFMVNMLLAVSLCICAAALLLRQRIPRRSTSESSDLYWGRAYGNAVVTWGVAEGAGLLAIVAYLLSGSGSALAVGALELFALVGLNPWYIERP